MHDEPIHVNADRFQDLLTSELPVLVDFWAPWCGPCLAVAPVLDAVAREMSGKLVVAKVNTDDNPAPAIDNRVQGIPTMVLFRGGREVDRLVGAHTQRDLVRWLDERLAATAVA